MGLPIVDLANNLFWGPEAVGLEAGSLEAEGVEARGSRVWGSTEFGLPILDLAVHLFGGLVESYWVCIRVWTWTCDIHTNINIYTNICIFWRMAYTASRSAVPPPLTVSVVIPLRVSSGVAAWR